jgi:hypothetical protein
MSIFFKERIYILLNAIPCYFLIFLLNVISLLFFKKRLPWGGTEIVALE